MNMVHIIYLFFVRIACHRSVQPMTKEKADIRKRLATSNYLRPGGPDGGRELVVNFEGRPMAETASCIEAYGQAGLDAFCVAVRGGHWQRFKVQPRMPFTIEEGEHVEEMKRRKAVRDAARTAAKKSKVSRCQPRVP